MLSYHDYSKPQSDYHRFVITRFIHFLVLVFRIRKKKKKRKESKAMWINIRSNSFKRQLPYNDNKIISMIIFNLSPSTLLQTFFILSHYPRFCAACCWIADRINIYLGWWCMRIERLANTGISRITPWWII